MARRRSLFRMAARRAAGSSMTVTRRGTKIPDYPKSIGVKAGVLAGATYPESEYKDAQTGEMVPDARAGMSVASIARALSYGPVVNPRMKVPRPFMDQTIAAHKAEWTNALVTFLHAGMPLAHALAEVGQVMEEDIKDTIQSWPADNAEDWAAHKGFNHGLEYTFTLLRAVKFEVTGL